MEAKLIQIGNSKGVRFPKALLQQTGMTDRIHIEAEGDRIVISPVHSVRSGWEAAFASAPEALAPEDLDWLGAELVQVDITP